MLASEPSRFGALTCPSSTGLGRTPAVHHPSRSRHPLGDSFDLGRTRGERGRALVAARFGNHDPDRHRDEPGPELRSRTVFVLDPAPFPVALVVQLRYRLVEPLRDL